MTGDEMERGIEFLLQSQANHEARLGELTERVGELTGKVNQLTEQVAETNKIVQLHAETQTQFIQIVTRHIEAQGEINASLRASIDQADINIRQADARIVRTDTRLDRLEAWLERYIEGRNGQG
jgi:chromosome segregation ATPase